MDLESEIKFNHDQILTEDVARSLEDFANAGLQGINYTSYIVQTRSMISTLNVSDLVKALKGVRSAANQVSSKLLQYLFLFCIIANCTIIKLI